MMLFLSLHLALCSGCMAQTSDGDKKYARYDVPAVFDDEKTTGEATDTIPGESPGKDIPDKKSVDSTSVSSPEDGPTKKFLDRTSRVVEIYKLHAYAPKTSEPALIDGYRVAGSVKTDSLHTAQISSILTDSASYLPDGRVKHSVFLPAAALKMVDSTGSDSVFVLISKNGKTIKVATGPGKGYYNSEPAADRVVQFLSETLREKDAAMPKGKDVPADGPGKKEKSPEKDDKSGEGHKSGKAPLKPGDTCSLDKE